MGKHILTSAEQRRVTKKALIWIHGESCLDCGRQYPPAVFHFHHRDPNSKDFNIGTVEYGRLKIFFEALKCDLLCANCHIERHNEISEEN